MTDLDRLTVALADRYTYPEATNLMAATLDLGSEPSVVTRQALFDWAYYEGAEPHANYEVMPGGEEYVMVRRTQAAHLILIQNVHMFRTSLERTPNRMAALRGLSKALRQQGKVEEADSM